MQGVSICRVFLYAGCFYLGHDTLGENFYTLGRGEAESC